MLAWLKSAISAEKYRHFAYEFLPITMAENKNEGIKIGGISEVHWKTSIP